MKKTVNNLYSNENDNSLRYYRVLLFVVGVVYLAWWLVVETILPNAYNPFTSRAVVCGIVISIGISSFYFKFVKNNISVWYLIAVCIGTFHYFYLFYNNKADVAWVSGCYITVVAVAASVQTLTSMIAYGIFVILLSIGMTILNPELRTSPFLSGIVTILIFAYLALRARLKLVAEARESHIQARRALDATFEGIAIHNGKILIYVNDAMCDMFGYTRKEMVGHSFHSFVTPESIQLADRQIAAQFENVYELTGIKKDGTRFPMEVRGKKHILADGSVGRIAALHDLTDKRKHEQSKILYEASQEALKLRNEFISIASHELKTPLTSIKLQTQMTNIKFRKGDTSALSPEHIKKFVDQIDRQADRLTNLVEDMLDVSRISLGKLVLEKEVTVLNDLIKETLESLNEIIKQNGNQIICDFEPNVIAAVDRFRIEQVMTNLLTNAIKYGEGKPITIRLKKHHQRVEFSVCDQGMGIAQENQERIFARFERAVAAKNISGLGLGLYISQQIVQSHNGQIIVKSAPHEGACFTVILPAH